jgi:uncharacterized protein (TIGR03790 family)
MIHSKQMPVRQLFAVVCVVALSFVVRAAFALEPSEVAILVNRNSPESVKLGEYYAAKRGVPRAQILALDLPLGEDMFRAGYTDSVVPAVRKWLADSNLRDRVRCLVTTYGVPLRIGRRLPTEAQKASLTDAENALTEALAAMEEIRLRLDTIAQKLPPVPAADDRGKDSSGRKRKSVEDQIKEVEEAYTAAQERVTKLEDEQVRAKAKEHLQSYFRALRGRSLGSATDEERQQREQLRALAQLMEQGRETLDDQKRWRELTEKIGGVEQLSRWLKVRVDNLSGAETAAAFDSELSLLWWDNYELYRWQPNPLRQEFDRSPRVRDAAHRIMMVARLDGPTAEIAQRLVDDAIAVEARGLEGIIYIDARGIAAGANANGYGRFDEALRRAAGILTDKGKLKVVLDNKPALFQKDDCPNAALYCGWYSLGKYVDAFQWTRGAVAYHVASSEAVTLRQKSSQVWCKRMLEEGVCVTLGPVGEPYLTAFPPPDEFFPLLMTGKWTVAECYYRTASTFSWMMTFIGDPLYRPFAKKPALAVEDLPAIPVIPEGWGK